VQDEIFRTLMAAGSKARDDADSDKPAPG
jgi:hypothetical protein